MIARVFAAIGLVLVPLAASARDVVLWDFLGGQLPGTWQGTEGVEAVPSREGLRVTVHKDGRLFRPFDIGRRVDEINIIFSGPHALTELRLVWHTPKIPTNNVFKSPFILQEDRSVAIVPVHTFGSNFAGTDMLGLEFPAGTQLTLREIQFVRLNTLEKITEAVKAFWTFDELKSTSINFLWGPLLAFSPAQRADLYPEGASPPGAWSGMRAIFAVLIIGALTCITWNWTRRCDWKMAPLHVFLIIFSACWILLDIRMGSEFLSYAIRDFRTYVFAEGNHREFRNFFMFHDFARHARPFIPQGERYAFVGIADALGSSLRYMTLPSLPINPEKEEANGPFRTWLVFMRPDVTVDDWGRLVRDGHLFAQSGTIVSRFSEDSFIYKIP